MSSHPVDVHVGRRLRSKRVIEGMSQDDLGKAVGVTFQQIQKYEKGLNRIGCSRLFDISNAINTPVSFFFEGLNKEGLPMSEQEVIESHTASSSASNSVNVEGADLNNKEVLALVRAYISIKDQQVRKKVISLIKSLTQNYNDEETILATNANQENKVAQNLSHA